MDRQLERIARQMERAGRILEAKALRAVAARYANLRLADLFALLAIITEEPNVQRRVQQSDRLLAAFREATASLNVEPIEMNSLLRAAVRSGVTQAHAMLTILATNPEFIDAFRTRPDREIDFLNHAAARLTRYWGIEQRRMAQEVESILVEALERGQGRQDIQQQLRQRLEVSKARASLIARNELGNAAGHAMRETQLEAGISEYVWYTAQDDRVRDMHRARHGKKYSWDDPPSDGHPGQPIQCRCVAIPVVPRVKRP